MELFESSFLFNSLSAALLASIAAGIIGTYVVVKRLVFITGGIAHSCYGGIGLGYFLGIPPMIGAAGFGLLSSFIIGAANRRLQQNADTVIGVLWAAGMAIGMIFIYLTPGYAPDLMSYLFGNIILIQSSDLVIIGITDIVIVGLVILLYREFRAILFDEEFATVGNLPVGFLYMLLLALIGITVVLLVRIIGIIMAIALLTIPAATARLFTHRLSTMMVIAVLLSAVFSAGGLLLSFFLEKAGVSIQATPVIILTASITYGITAIIAAKKTRTAR